MLKIRLTALFLGNSLFLASALCQEATIQEDFAADPAANGWQVFGNSNLFHWNASNKNLEVTWDSSQANSYFHHALGTSIHIDDDFSLSFDLRLSDFVAGANPLKAGPFQVAVGLLDLAEASGPGFLRGTGANSPDLAEFSFFPDPGGAWQWGPSLTSTLIDWSGTNWSSGGFAPLALTTNDVFHVALLYTATNQTLHTTITRNGEAFGPVSDAVLNSSFPDFHVDHVAVCSYSDAGQDPAYAGSILAHGTIDNFEVTIPLPVTKVAGQFTNGLWQAQFLSRSNWLYSLERTSDFQSWSTVSSTASGNGGTLSLLDTNAPQPHAFYRVFANRPQ
jgi:hypothetical protein